MLILSLTVVGTLAFTQLGVDRLPSVDFATVTVTTRLPGAAPEQFEREGHGQDREAVKTISGGASEHTSGARADSPLTWSRSLATGGRSV